jgi:catechol 2,3-dioxygenase-like lactoylglutathione lyase family enzyme
MQRDNPGVHSLDHFSFSVPVLAAAARFYTTFGLDVRENGRQLELFTFGSAHRWAVITESARKAVRYVSFGAYEDDLSAFAARLEMSGIRCVDPLPDAPADGLWFRDPAGQLIQIRAAEKSSPERKSELAYDSAASGKRSAPLRDEAKAVHPRRLAHALFFTPDVGNAVRFYADILGLRLSDHPGPVAFLHGIHGSDHHLIAFAHSPTGIGYHHSAWDVSSIHEVGFGAMRMSNAGHALGWGVGRHALGSNYFYYVRDPWGSYAEYSCDIDYIPAGSDWEAKYPPPENSFYLWGPNAPQDFAFNYEGAGEAKR